MTDSHAQPVEADRFRRLMMAAVDGEISAADRRELAEALERDPALRREWDTFAKLKEVTETMTPKRPPEEVWDGYWDGVYRRLERGIGWVLTSIGAIVLLTWGAWTWVGDLLRDESMPPVVRWATLALVAGLVVRKTDPYKDILR